jgi:hypothetical protein
MPNFICNICNYSCSLNYSGTHLKRKHELSGKEYYDKYLKQADEGCCKICNNSTSFYTIKMGYKKTCSVSCANKYKNIILYEEYGVGNYFELQSTKDKAKISNLKRLGVENPSQSLDIKLAKKRTMLKNYGVEFGLQSSRIKDKQEASMLLIYGAKNAMHVPELVQKALDNGAGRVSAVKYVTKFGDEITIQGSYEKKFVELCEVNNVRILNGPMIKYKFEDSVKRYFVDFEIIQDGHRLVEIKSSYYFAKYKEQIKAKNNAANKWSKSKNYKPFIMMIDDIYIP